MAFGARGVWYKRRCEARLKAACKAQGIPYTPRYVSPPEEIERERTARDKGTRVYFIQRGEDGPIKIGVSDNPAQRLEDLQAANAEPLFLRTAIPGGRHLERRLHLLFDRSRLLGEWFSPSPDLLSFIAKPDLTHAWTVRLKRSYRRKNQNNGSSGT